MRIDINCLFFLKMYGIFILFIVVYLKMFLILEKFIWFFEIFIFLVFVCLLFLFVIWFIWELDIDEGGGKYGGCLFALFCCWLGIWLYVVYNCGGICLKVLFSWEGWDGGFLFGIGNVGGGWYLEVIL